MHLARLKESTSWFACWRRTHLRLHVDGRVQPFLRTSARSASIRLVSFNMRTNKYFWGLSGRKGKSRRWLLRCSRSFWRFSWKPKGWLNAGRSNLLTSGLSGHSWHGEVWIWWPLILDFITPGIAFDYSGDFLCLGRCSMVPPDRRSTGNGNGKTAEAIAHAPFPVARNSFPNRCFSRGN